MSKSDRSPSVNHPAAAGLSVSSQGNSTPIRMLGIPSIRKSHCQGLPIVQSPAFAKIQPETGDPKIPAKATAVMNIATILAR